MAKKAKTYQVVTHTLIHPLEAPPHPGAVLFFNAHKASFGHPTPAHLETQE
jgi:hypothetical protein